ncbi:hypothetical protein [Pseudomaricurvus sp. HS19]|uniref:hypothetical protein n=1 Tax=Pseudomaricurvus sp. HS19 TaxID=2692626 RepID=UPI0019277673|nr:hypothetical protein [Pseudomaricurvus sp. HS19]
MLVLGHHLATELGFSDSCDTLGKWMSHHLAEVMDRAENESDLQKKEEYQKEVVELILKVWKHRTSLQPDAYPLARFRGIIDSLSILSPEANVWERNRLGKYESLAADSFSMLVDLYRALHFIEFISLKSFKDKKVPPSVLSDEEQELYDFLTSWAEEELKFRSESDSFTDETEVEQATDSVCEFIDGLCEKLNTLKNELKPLNK